MLRCSLKIRVTCMFMKLTFVKVLTSMKYSVFLEALKMGVGGREPSLA